MLIGKSAAMQQLRADVQLAAESCLPTLIQGETGTGKELVVQAIHQLSDAAKGPLVIQNCAAITESLFESIFFGHVRGSFTGAETQMGKFEKADGGFLVLDEAGEMLSSLQAKLLRIIEDQVVEPIGGDPFKVNVRIIASTNRDLDAAVAAGTFRLDLYTRLSGTIIRMPALRERLEDIPELAQHFLQKLRATTKVTVTGVSDEALKLLMSYHWPGNVRQLQQRIIQAAERAKTGVLLSRHFPADVFSKQTSVGTYEQTLEEFERFLLTSILERAKWDSHFAARLMNTPHRTVQRRIDRLKIKIPK